MRPQTSRLCLFLVVLIIGCGGGGGEEVSRDEVCAPEGMEAVTDADARISVNGVSVVPPMAGGWLPCFRRDSAVSISFFANPAPWHSVAATLVAAPGLALPESLSKSERLQQIDSTLLAFVGSRLERGDRIKVLDISAAESPLEDCRGYTYRTEDRDAPGFDETLLLTGFGILCIHPDSTDVIVALDVSQRRPMDIAADEGLDSGGRRFLESLRFEDPSQ